MLEVGTTMPLNLYYNHNAQDWSKTMIAKLRHRKTLTVSMMSKSGKGVTSRTIHGRDSVSLRWMFIEVNVHWGECSLRWMKGDFIDGGRKRSVILQYELRSWMSLSSWAVFACLETLGQEGELNNFRMSESLSSLKCREHPQPNH